MSSTGATRLDSIIFYLDESIHSRVLVGRLATMNVTARYPGEAFPFGTRDEVWLSACGQRGWIVLMRDQRIRYRVLERATLIRAGVGAFVLTAGQATAMDTADAIERLVPTFARIAARVPRPFLFSFGLRGRPTRVQLGRP